MHEQAAVGLDIINDGEQGKSSFVAYRLERLSGFELVDTSEVTANTVGGLVEADDFPEFFAHLWQWNRAGTDAAPSHQVLACTAPSGGKISPGRRDIDNLRAAAAAVAAVEVFMTSISPATYAPPNLHYPSEDAYLDALAAAMSREYKAILDAGFILQIDAPDLTTMFRMSRMSESEHHQAHAQRVGPSTEQSPASPRPNPGARLLGRRRGAPQSRHPAARSSSIPYCSSIHKAWLFGCQRPPLPRMAGLGRSPLPDDKVPDPRGHRLHDQRDRAPRGRRRTYNAYASVIGPERLIARRGLRLRTVAQVGEVDAASRRPSTFTSRRGGPRLQTQLQALPRSLRGADTSGGRRLVARSAAARL